MASFEKHSITADSAQIAIAAAAAKARQMGQKMCIAIADEAGILKASCAWTAPPR